MALDITRILGDWQYEPGKISVRRILGGDGKAKIQLRLDLGLLQMESDGRPDGQRPYGCESVLEYYTQKLARFRADRGSDRGFELDEDQCEELRNESVMYYHRYLSEFALEDYEAVQRDTARNLLVLDLCSQYGSDEIDRVVLEQYRPYILMMNARARALQAMEDKDFATAREAVEEGLEGIRSFAATSMGEGMIDGGGEEAVLQALLKEIDRRRPRDPVQMVEESLARAVREERYEDAARLRDRLSLMQRRQKSPH
jgi:hypothetical protein